MTTLGLVARLGCVFALLGGVLWLLRRTNGLGVRRGTPLQVLSTTRLGKTATLSVVRVHDEEYVLGVTGSGITVVSSRPSPEPAPIAVTANAPVPPAGTAPAPVTPTSAQFLRAGWEVLRKRPVEDVELSADAVATALAQARGLAAPVAGLGGRTAGSRFPSELADALSAAGPRTRTTPAAPATPGDTPSPPAADGSAAAFGRVARRRPPTSTDASPREELDPWPRTRRPFRTSEAGSAVA